MLQLREMPKRLVQDLAGIIGYRIERIRPRELPNLDVIPYLVNAISAKHTPLHIVQIGANDGLRADPVRPIVESHNVRAVLLEPLPKLFAQLNTNYAEFPSVTPVFAALDSCSGQREMFYVSPTDGMPDWAEGLGSFDRRVIESHRTAIPGIENRIQSCQVNTMTPQDILAAYNLPRVDWLQIDTEGFDLRVIELFFVANIFPELLSFEHFHLTMDDQLAANRLLKQHDYSFVHVFGDTIALRGEE
jgi:FkbM family methyltransferase